jgi:hypothetical protein
MRFFYVRAPDTSSIIEVLNFIKSTTFLSEISAKGYELMDDDGRGKIGEMLEEGLALGSAEVAGAVLAALQRSGR